MNNETATEVSAQDIASRVEDALYPSEEPVEDAEFEEVPKDEGDDPLPEGDDSDEEDDEGSEIDLDDVAEGDELTLADYLGLEDDRIGENENGEIVFNAIIDGETTQVPLKDLAASFQLQGHVNNKSIALEGERKKLEEVQTKVATELTQRVQGVNKLLELAEAELVSEYQSIDWDRLRAEDPANWTAYRQEYSEKARKVKQAKELALEEADRIQRDQQSQFMAKAQEYSQEQERLMLADNPEWADKSKKDTALGEMRSFISQYGFSEEDAKGVTDHRLVRLIKDAQAYKASLKTGENKRNKGNKLPKFQKPGANRGNAASLAKARRVKATRAKVKKTGHVRDVADAIIDRM